VLLQFLRAALEARLIFSFNYDDKPRFVEPHALGLNKDGFLVMRGWQQNGDNPGWRLFILEKADTITVLEQQASEAPRPGYKLGDKQMTEIFCELPELIQGNGQWRAGSGAIVTDWCDSRNEAIDAFFNLKRTNQALEVAA
jgi:hypothetical protein